MLKFLHLADIHLDTTFHCRSENIRTHLRNALRSAFERAIDCAIGEQVQAVLIAGDLFDDVQLSFATERFLLSQCQRLHEAAIPCFYVTGNHDPGGSTFRANRMEWPPSFHYIRDRTPVAFEITGQNGEVIAKIVGAGHVTKKEQDNLATAFPVAEGGIPHIGLLHTQVTSAQSVESHDRYAPCAVDDLQRTRYHYWALGHIHVRQQVCDKAQAWYAGNMQGRNPRETGAKGGLLVTLDGSGAAEVEFRAFAPTQWAALKLDNLEEVHTLHDLEQKARQAFEKALEEHGEAKDWLLRFVLTGECPLADEIHSGSQQDEIEEDLARELDVLDVEVRAQRLTRPVDVDKHRGEPHLLGEVLDLIDEAAMDPALLHDLAPEALAGAPTDEADREAYLQSLLEGLNREAVLRMLVEEATS